MLDYVIKNGLVFRDGCVLILKHLFTKNLNSTKNRKVVSAPCPTRMDYQDWRCSSVVKRWVRSPALPKQRQTNKQKPSRWIQLNY
jgi:hypothetical protein